MQLDRSELIALLRSRGDFGIAAQAELSLPELIDTDKHQGRLDRFGIDVDDLPLETLWVGTDPPRR